MQDVEMTSIEDLKCDWSRLEKELLNGHRIDPNLYVEYLSLIHI